MRVAETAKRQRCIDKWPYHTDAWKQWLSDTRAGKCPPLPTDESDTQADKSPAVPADE